MSYYKDLYFVLAGRLSEDYEDIAETVHSIGAHVTRRVSKKVTAVVLGSNVSGRSRKLLDAKRLGIAIVDEKQMWSMLGMRMATKTQRNSPATSKTRRSSSSSYKSAHISAARKKLPASARRSSTHSVTARQKR